MPLYFQSIRSGSSGNCVLLATDRSTLLIDAGFRTIRDCRAALGPLLPGIDGVVVSHLHGDHVHYCALRVLQEHGVPICVHESQVAHLRERHFRDQPFRGLPVETFDGQGFQVGEFTIEPFAVPHYPGLPTFGFQVTCHLSDGPRRVVVATDLADARRCARHFVDADFIYIEANHDPDLLRRNPNPNAQYHLSNEQCGRLLRHALDRSTARPAAIMLGHLSDERNEPLLARDTVWALLDSGQHGHIELHIAPRHEPSDPIHIA